MCRLRHDADGRGREAGWKQSRGEIAWKGVWCSPCRVLLWIRSLIHLYPLLAGKLKSMAETALGAQLRSLDWIAARVALHWLVSILYDSFVPPPTRPNYEVDEISISQYR